MESHQKFRIHSRFEKRTVAEITNLPLVYSTTVTTSYLPCFVFTELIICYCFISMHLIILLIDLCSEILRCNCVALVQCVVLVCGFIVPSCICESQPACVAVL